MVDRKGRDLSWEVENLGLKCLTHNELSEMRWISGCIS